MWQAHLPAWQVNEPGLHVVSLICESKLPPVVLARLDFSDLFLCILFRDSDPFVERHTLSVAHVVAHLDHPVVRYEDLERKFVVYWGQFDR